MIYVIVHIPSGNIIDQFSNREYLESIAEWFRLFALDDLAYEVRESEEE